MLSLGMRTSHITPILHRNWICSLNFQALQPCSPWFQRSNAGVTWGVTISHITPVLGWVYSVLFLFNFLVCVYFFFLSFFCFDDLLVDGCALKFVVVVIVLLSICFYLLVGFFSFLEGIAVFISVWAVWGHNHLLVWKITFLILKLYTNFESGRDVWMYLKNYSSFLYFKYFLLIYCNFSYCSCLGLWYVCVSMHGYVFPWTWVQFNCCYMRSPNN